MTVYGDAIVPRGGSVGLGTLTTILGGLGIGEGAVRTAISRLAADGWLERSRAGRNSFYRLAAKGEAVFAAATEHIYDPAEPAWDGRLALFLAEGAASAWRAAGFGEAAPGLWVAPAAAASQAPPSPALRLDGSGSQADMAALAARAWALDRVAQGYRGFLSTYGPLSEELAAPAAFDGFDCLLLRLLLVHDYRRVILRDPILPPALLPPGWPGFAARRLCGLLYRAVLAGSEAWLDRHATTAGGPLPPPPPTLRERFATVTGRLDFVPRL